MGNRVAPRCTHAETILMVSQRRNGIRTERNLSMPAHSLHDLCDVLLQNRVDTLICGGITHDNKKFLESHNLDIIENVACSIEDIISALQKGDLKPGYGIQSNRVSISSIDDSPSSAEGKPLRSLDDRGIKKESIDCLACVDRVCLRGEPCHAEISNINRKMVEDSEMKFMLEAATDVACEDERTLCRVSELIYFCLELKYQRIGLAYCVDLSEPAEILARLLRRFFDVFPICCKIGGLKQDNPFGSCGDVKKRISRDDISCNPLGQARVLNHLKTDLNVLVGLCMGADCIFMQGSQAPVTTLFVKDRSLVNNPISALYSDYYLKEAAQTRAARV